MSPRNARKSRSEMTEEEREAERSKERLRQKRRDQGKPAFVLPAEMDAVRVLLGRARAYGMDDHTITEQCNIAGSNTIWKIRTGATKRVKRPTYEKIMRLRPEDAVPVAHPVLGKRHNGTLDPAVGTQRRLQGLRADGFPNTVLASMLGVTPEAVSEMTRRTRPFVLHSSRVEVAELYEKLAASTPADYEVSPVTAQFTSTWAAKAGWFSRGCWTSKTIDDPDAFPDRTGLCGTPFGVFFHRHEQSRVCGPCQAAEKPVRFSGDLLKEMRERAGLSQRSLEAELGLTKGHVHHWESGRYAPRRAVLDGLMSYFDVTVEDLYEIEEA